MSRDEGGSLATCSVDTTRYSERSLGLCADPSKLTWRFTQLLSKRSPFVVLESGRRISVPKGFHFQFECRVVGTWPRLREGHG